MWANRNAFYYTLDRVTGEFLVGKPFAKQTWAEGAGFERPSDPRARHLPHTRGDACIPAGRRRYELVLPRLQPADGALLRAGL